MIALLTLDILDYTETNMRNARLIKRNSLSRQFHTEFRQETDSQPIIDVRKSAMKWVRERQELRQINPRRQFAELFRNAG